MGSRRASGSARARGVGSQAAGSPPTPLSDPKAHPCPRRSVRPPDGACHLSGGNGSPAEESLGCLVPGNAIYPLISPSGISSFLAPTAAPVLALCSRRRGILTIFLWMWMPVSRCPGPGHSVLHGCWVCKALVGLNLQTPVCAPWSCSAPRRGGAGAGDCWGRTNRPSDRSARPRRSRHGTRVHRYMLLNQPWKAVIKKIDLARRLCSH